MRSDDPHDSVGHRASEAAIATSLPAGAHPQLRAALQQFIDDFSHHSRKNSELIDVLVQAMKTVNQELHHQKVKSHLLDARLKKAEARVGELSRVVEAFRRQGWLQ